MKLFFCTACHDLVALKPEKRICSCGLSEGKYVDSLNAIISGPCIPVGIANSSFVAAIQDQPEEGMGKEFVAFVIPKVCDTIIHEK